MSSLSSLKMTSLLRLKSTLKSLGTQPAVHSAQALPGSTIVGHDLCGLGEIVQKNKSVEHGLNLSRS